MKKIKNLILILVLMFAGIFIVNAEDVAQIGDTKYESIEAAISASQENDEIDILVDIISSNSEISVSADKKITLNLNEKTLYCNIENEGDLILKNGNLNYHSSATGNIKNLSGAKMSVEDLIITLAEDSDLNNTEIINNAGELLVKNVQYTSYNDSILFAFLENKKGAKATFESGTFKGGKPIFNYNDGEIIINGGTFEFTNDSIQINNDTIIVNNGKFISPGKIFSNQKNGAEIEINGGEFNSGLSSTMFDNFVTEEGDIAVITINGGTFNSSSTIASQGTSKNGEIIINGGFFNHIGEDSVFINNCYAGECYLYINGGTINSEKGTGITSTNHLFIGKNDNNVSNSIPTINIKIGKIYASGNESQYTMNFYDGKIILNEKIDRNINVPEGYYVQYDLNNDNSYTAYLKKIVDEQEKKEEDIKEEKEEIKTENKKEENTSKDKVENPKTGMNLGFGILILVILMGGIGYFLIRKQSKFPKHN